MKVITALLSHQKKYVPKAQIVTGNSYTGKRS